MQTKPKGVKTQIKALNGRVHTNGTVCVITEQSSFSCKEPKGVTTQMKAFHEYILMVLFVLLLKRVRFLTYASLLIHTTHVRVTCPPKQAPTQQESPLLTCNDLQRSPTPPWYVTIYRNQYPHPTLLK